jgi:hypothetical protein
MPSGRSVGNRTYGGIAVALHLVLAILCGLMCSTAGQAQQVTVTVTGSYSASRSDSESDGTYSALVPTQNGPFNCNVNVTDTPILRSEGLGEFVGDIVITCTGGTPTPVGNTIPQGTLTVSFNVPVTSRLFGSQGASEAMLLLDEPNSGLPGATTIQLACANALTGCQVQGTSPSPGVAGPEPFDGSPGRPNVFEGIVSGNSVSFFGVPIDQPGQGNRIFRIVNVRINASEVSLAVAESAPVQANLSVSGGVFFPFLSPPSPIVGFVQASLGSELITAGGQSPLPNTSFSRCAGLTFCPFATVRFSELFASAFKTRVDFTVPGPQDVPGTVYEGESGFFNPALAASNPNLVTAGLADFGTRLKAAFTNVPAGMAIWVSATPVSSMPAGSNAVLTATETGPLSAVPPSATIGGVPAVQLPVVNGTATAVWEVTSTLPTSIQGLDFAVWLTNAPSTGAAAVAGTYAPNADQGAFPLPAGASAQNATFPEPRFGPLVELPTYFYKGNPFTQATGVYTTSDSLSGSITLRSPLAANLNNANISTQIATFSFSDGVYLWNPTDSRLNTAIFSTDPNGNITFWSFILAGTAAPVVGCGGTCGALQTVGLPALIYDSRRKALWFRLPQSQSRPASR